MHTTHFEKNEPEYKKHSHHPTKLPNVVGVMKHTKGKVQLHFWHKNMQIQNSAAEK